MSPKTCKNDIRKHFMCIWDPHQITKKWHPAPGFCPYTTSLRWHFLSFYFHTLLFFAKDARRTWLSNKTTNSSVACKLFFKHFLRIINMEKPDQKNRQYLPCFSKVFVYKIRNIYFCDDRMVSLERQFYLVFKSGNFFSSS